ncbi:MGDG synthase family glycosyltransferase [Bacillus piscicola]|uniref:MGDG synthase family glycosyltransferase n=1 Tax=Bacillus piscicola TaxID=1632684 RepID=UPI001F09FEE9|nr:glycosyltransferase [Bacillus piscicola]
MHIHILTAAFGNGHDRAALLLEQAAVAQQDTAVITRPLDDHFPPLFRISKKVYKRLLSSFPNAWRVIANQNGSGHNPHLHTLTRLLEPSLKEAFRADIVLSVHPLLTYLAGEVKRKQRYNNPLYSISTDYWTSPLASHPTVNGLFVSKVDKLLERGARPFVFPAGIPASIGDNTYTKKEICLKNGWNSKKPLVLICGGGEGIFPYKDALGAVEQLSVSCTVVILSGRRIWSLNHFSTQHDLFVQPFTDQFHDYLMAADLIISKAGGMTMAEAALTQVPVIIYAPLPGQEEKNAHCLHKHKAAYWAKTPEEVRQKAENLLISPFTAARYKRRLRHIQQKKSADTIVTMSKSLPYVQDREGDFYSCTIFEKG